MTGYINSEKEPYKPLEDQVFLYADSEQEVVYDVINLIFYCGQKEIYWFPY